MEPTLPLGTIVTTTSPSGSDPLRVGEIVVFHPPVDAASEVCGAPHPATSACGQPESQASSEMFIKRIVAGPGDAISIVNGHVIRNGEQESDSYIAPCAPGTPACNLPTQIEIPAGMWFTLGDNRGESDDSRFWGPVPSSWIAGMVTDRYLPSASSSHAGSADYRRAEPDGPFRDSHGRDYARTVLRRLRRLLRCAPVVAASLACLGLLIAVEPAGATKIPSRRQPLTISSDHLIAKHSRARGPAHAHAAIINGHDVAPSSWPWVARVQSSAGWCTGTVVSPMLVLTAAHCLIDTSTNHWNPIASFQIITGLTAAASIVGTGVRSNSGLVYPSYGGLDLGRSDYSYSPARRRRRRCRLPMPALRHPLPLGR